MKNINELHELTQMKKSINDPDESGEHELKKKYQLISRIDTNEKIINDPDESGEHE